MCAFTIYVWPKLQPKFRVWVPSPLGSPFLDPCPLTTIWADIGPMIWPISRTVVGKQERHRLVSSQPIETLQPVISPIGRCHVDDLRHFALLPLMASSPQFPLITGTAAIERQMKSDDVSTSSQPLFLPTLHVLRDSSKNIAGSAVLRRDYFEADPWRLTFRGSAAFWCWHSV